MQDEVVQDEEWLRQASPQRVMQRVQVREREQERGWDVDMMVRAVAASIRSEAPSQLSTPAIYQTVRESVREAAKEVASRQASDEERWSVSRLNRFFASTLLAISRAKLCPTQRSLASIAATSNSRAEVDIVEEGAGIATGVGGAASAASAASAGVGGAVAGGAGAVAGAGGAVAGPPATLTTILNIDSSARNLSMGVLPNVIQVPLTGDNGLSLRQALQGVTSIELLEVSVNDFFTERPGDAIFYIAIGEVGREHNRQSDPYDNHCHFKCEAKQRNSSGSGSRAGSGGGARAKVLSGKVRIPASFDLAGNLTLRFLDDQKQPLAVEQDVYGYISHTWDDVNNAIIFELPRHSIQNADRISIRGITCTEDPYLFSDAKKLRAQVIDLTHIRIYVWRAQGPPSGASPPSLEDGRHVVSSGGAIVCLNNVIRLTLSIESRC